MDTGMRTSEWTTETLKEHFEKILEEKDKALSAALIAVKEENRKTEIAAEKRFELLNELRGDVATKTELGALEKIVNDLKGRLDILEGKSSGLSQGWVILIGAVGLVSGVIGIFYAITK
jgi:hypothetical protein